MGQEEYDPKEAFLKYKAEQERAGVPVDERAVEAGKRELELGEKGGFAVYGDEPNREDKFKNDPEGALYNTDLTEDELQDKIAVFTEARKHIVSFLENPDIENFKITRETTLFDLEDKLKDQKEELSRAVSNLAKYNFDGNVALFDLPQEIGEVIKKDERILEHMKRKTAP